MIVSQEILYSRAYVELNELLKHLSPEDNAKIPEVVKENILNKMDKEYLFEFDSEKSIIEQNYMTETRALYVKLYEKYLAPETEKEFWKNYDKICYNMIEEEKKKKYNSNDIFYNKKNKNDVSSENVISENIEIVVYKNTIFSKIANFIKNIFKLK